MCLSRSDSEQQLFAKRQGLNGREQMVVEATPLQARMCGKEPAGSASLGREPNDDAQMEVLAGRFDGLVDWWTGGLAVDNHACSAVFCVAALRRSSRKTLTRIKVMSRI